MSDLPSAAVVSLGLWLFWRGLDRGAPWWLASGFAAGASTVFRATNPLVFLPLFAGTVLRRDWRAGYLVMGGLLGIGVRLLAVHYYFGEPFFERARYYYSPESIMERVPLYLLGLLVFVPGGLAFALAYRGRRRAEVLVTPLLFVGVYLLQLWSTVETGLAKRLVLALRYFIPLLPLLCFAMAESLPRLWKTLRGRLSAPSQRRAESWATAVVALYLLGVGVASASVHPVMAQWSRSQGIIRDAIDRHVGDAVLVTNLAATRKHLRLLDRTFRPLWRKDVSNEDLQTLVERHGECFVVLLDRTDSVYWRRETASNQDYAEKLHPAAELLMDEQLTPTDRLRIWRLTSAAFGPERPAAGGDAEALGAQPGTPARKTVASPPSS
jgi:hypothetical protein